MSNRQLEMVYNNEEMRIFNIYEGDDREIVKLFKVIYKPIEPTTHKSNRRIKHERTKSVNKEIHKLKAKRTKRPSSISKIYNCLSNAAVKQIVKLYKECKLSYTYRKNRYIKKSKLKSKYKLPTIPAILEDYTDGYNDVIMDDFIPFPINYFGFSIIVRGDSDEEEIKNVTAVQNKHDGYDFSF